MPILNRTLVWRITLPVFLIAFTFLCVVVVALVTESAPLAIACFVLLLFSDLTLVYLFYRHLGKKPKTNAGALPSTPSNLNAIAKRFFFWFSLTIFFQACTIFSTSIIVGESTDKQFVENYLRLTKPITSFFTANVSAVSELSLYLDKMEYGPNKEIVLNSLTLSLAVIPFSLFGTAVSMRAASPSITMPKLKKEVGWFVGSVFVVGVVICAILIFSMLFEVGFSIKNMDKTLKMYGGVERSTFGLFLIAVTNTLFATWLLAFTLLAIENIKELVSRSR